MTSHLEYQFRTMLAENYGQRADDFFKTEKIMVIEKGICGIDSEVIIPALNSDNSLNYIIAMQVRIGGLKAFEKCVRDIACSWKRKREHYEAVLREKAEKRDAGKKFYSSLMNLLEKRKRIIQSAIDSFQRRADLKSVVNSAIATEFKTLEAYAKQHSELMGSALAYVLRIDSVEERVAKLLNEVIPELTKIYEQTVLKSDIEAIFPTDFLGISPNS